MTIFNGEEPEQLVDERTSPASKMIFCISIPVEIPLSFNLLPNIYLRVVKLIANYCWHGFIIT